VIGDEWQLCLSLEREAFELLPYPHAAPTRALLVSTGGAGALKHSYSRAPRPTHGLPARNA